MQRLTALIATTALFLAGAPAAHALASPSSNAPIRESYSTPGFMIDIVGHPKIVAPEPVADPIQIRHTSSVKVRYACTSSADIQIGARVSGPSPDHSNRWARFGYPFTAAVCDGKQRVVDLRLTAYHWDDLNFVHGDTVRVGVDLIEYEFVPGLAVPPLPKAALAGSLLANVKITGGR